MVNTHLAKHKKLQSYLIKKEVRVVPDCESTQEQFRKIKNEQIDSAISKNKARFAKKSFTEIASIKYVTAP